MNKDLAQALNSYKILISSNIDSTIILDNIAKQFRLLMQIKATNTYNEQELSRKLGVNPYTIKKLYPYTNEYSNEEIVDILYKLSQIDIDSKVYSYDRNSLLETFLITL